MARVCDFAAIDFGPAAIGGGGVGAGAATVLAFTEGVGVARTVAVLVSGAFVAAGGLISAGLGVVAGVAFGSFVEAIDFAPAVIVGRGVEVGSSALRLFAEGEGVARVVVDFGAGVLGAGGLTSTGAGEASGRGAAGGASAARLERERVSGALILAARLSELRKDALRMGGGGVRAFSHSRRFSGSLASSEVSCGAVSPGAENPGIKSAAAKVIRKRNLPEG